MSASTAWTRSCERGRASTPRSASAWDWDRSRPASGAMADARLAPVLALGTAQTLAWASSYYVPAVLAAPMARDLGVTPPTVFAAFSAALLVSAALGPQ